MSIKKISSENYYILDYLGRKPRIDQTVFIGSGVCCIGDVTIEENSSIWFNAVLRGDVAHIRIGKRTNIQDGTVIHTSRDNGPTLIGSDITVGHMAMIHACTLEDECFIGMKAIIMDKSIIGKGSLIAAGSLVTAGKRIGENELWAGSPARFVRKITPDDKKMMKDNAESYVQLAKNYQL